MSLDASHSVIVSKNKLHIIVPPPKQKKETTDMVECLAYLLKVANHHDASHYTCDAMPGRQVKVNTWIGIRAQNASNGGGDCLDR